MYCLSEARIPTGCWLRPRVSFRRFLSEHSLYASCDEFVLTIKTAVNVNASVDVDG